MRGPVIAASVVALLVAPVATPRPASAAARQAAQGPIEQELIALDKKIEDAVRRREPSAIADLLTDDFRQVVPVGVRTKAEVLKTLATPPADAAPPPTPLEPTYSVHVHGDTAVMTHVTKQTDPHDPAPGGGVMHVFLRQQGRWKMAGSSSAPAQLSAERSVNNAGYALMTDGKLKEAIELFKINVQLYPQSWNVYDSLGEAYASAGDTALAIQNYEKSIQLNPKNETGKAALAKLKSK
jgi:tetratricopeptide (TPR) repeat protein